MDLLQYSFFQNALVGAVLASIISGMVGSYIVSKKMTFISGGLSHTSFGGIGIGYFMGINPIITGIVFAILAGLGIEYLSQGKKVRTDSLIAAFWSTGMAIGILFVAMTPGYAPDLMTYLFGNILTISRTELVALAVLAVVVLIVFYTLYYPILYVAFDEDFAKTRKLPVKAVKYLMMILIALTIVLSIRIAGIILILSLLTIPQETANLFTKQLHKMMGISVVLGIIGCVTGLFFSYYFNFPTGPVIILTLVGIYLIARMLSLVRVKSALKTI